MNRQGKIHWPLLIGVAAVSILLLLGVVMLKKEFFLVVLPLLLIAFVAYVLYVFLLALGFGDKPEDKHEKKEFSDE